MKSLLRTLIMALLLTGAAWAGPAEEAGELLQRGDRIDALQLLRDAAGRGDAEAQALLGSLHVYRIGAPRDDAQGLVWYRKAAGRPGWGCTTSTARASRSTTARPCAG